jgi:hypothetical protein
VRSRAMVLQRKMGRPCSSNSWSRPVRACWHGSNIKAERSTTTPFRAGLLARLTSARDSTHGSWTDG